MTVTSTNQKVQFNGNGSTTVFAYNFKIFASSDLSVILRSAAGTETVQQLTTNYTVSGVGETSGGNVTMGTAPASGTTLTILRVQPNLQGLDLVPNDPFPAGSMEDALDKLTFMVQTHDEEIGRSIKASKTNVIADSEFTVSATDRANKLFSFDSSGNLSIAQELGTYKGNWAASTTYAVRDLVKDTSTNNIFICVTAHTSSGSQPLTTNTDSAKWALIVDAASATTSATAAASSATASASSATASASSASSSSTKADEAAASASTASTKAGEAASSATAAASSATSAASTLTTFQQQYHGAASSDPTSNLTEGDLYFKTGSGGGLRVYNGSAWVNAAFDVSGALINTNNLSDVSNAATALTNLGVNATAAEINLIDGGTARGTTAVADGDGVLINDAGTMRMTKVDTLATYVGTKVGGGGEQTFTAGASISAGALVGLLPNGTIKTMGASSGSPNQVSNFSGNNGGYIQALTYDTTNNKVIYFYRDQANSNYLTCRVGTVSGTSITFGTAVAISSVPQRMNATFDTAAGKAVCVYEDTDNSQNGYAVVVNVSGTTPSFGSPAEFSGVDCASLDACFDSNSNKVVIAYKASSQGRCRVATVSGTSISYGTEATFTTSSPLSGNFVNMAIEFDSNANKVVIQWTDDGASGDPGTAIVGTVSGTDISFGTAAVFSTSLVNHNVLAFDSNANKFLHVYAKSAAIQCRVGTVSGTDISFGTEQSLTNFSGDYASAVTFDSNTNQMVVFFEAVTTHSGTVIKGQISGTDFFSGSPSTFAEFNVMVGNIVFDPDTNQCICAYRDDRGNDLFLSVFNSGNPSWVGIAAESISSSATGAVTVIGGINTSQSSLVTGATYSLPSTASILTAGTSNAIGVALSSSSLYINTGKL